MRTPELLSDPAYHDEDAARAYLEEVRWPDGPYLSILRPTRNCKAARRPVDGAGLVLLLGMPG